MPRSAGPTARSHADHRLLPHVEVALAQEQHQDRGDGRQREAGSPAKPPGRGDVEGACQEVEAHEPYVAAEEPERRLAWLCGAEHGPQPAEEDKDYWRAEAGEVVQGHVVTPPGHPELRQLHAPMGRA